MLLARIYNQPEGHIAAASVELWQLHQSQLAEDGNLTPKAIAQINKATRVDTQPQATKETASIGSVKGISTTPWAMDR